MLIVLGVLGVLLLMGVAGSMMSGASPVWALLPLAIVGFAGNMSWGLWRRNAPGAFDPRSLPDDFAPVG